MRVPPAAIGEGDLDANIRLDQLRNLQERLAEPARRVVGAVLGTILRRIGALEHLYGFESLARGGREQSGSGPVVQFFERAGETIARGFLGRAQAKRLEVIDRQ